MEARLSLPSALVYRRLVFQETSLMSAPSPRSIFPGRWSPRRLPLLLVLHLLRPGFSQRSCNVRHLHVGSAEIVVERIRKGRRQGQFFHCIPGSVPGLHRKMNTSFVDLFRGRDTRALVAGWSRLSVPFEARWSCLNRASAVDLESTFHGLSGGAEATPACEPAPAPPGSRF